MLHFSCQSRHPVHHGPSLTSAQECCATPGPAHCPKSNTPKWQRWANGGMGSFFIVLTCSYGSFSRYLLSTSKKNVWGGFVGLCSGYHRVGARPPNKKHVENGTATLDMAGAKWTWPGKWGELPSAQSAILGASPQTKCPVHTWAISKIWDTLRFSKSDFASGCWKTCDVSNCPNSKSLSIDSLVLAQFAMPKWRSPNLELNPPTHFLECTP